MYAPRNEFCMIWVIFWMPTDQVMAFLCFISDNQSVDMSGQGWVGGRGCSCMSISKKNLLYSEKYRSRSVDCVLIAIKEIMKEKFH